MSVWILTGTIVITVLAAAVIYNRLVTARNDVQGAWSQIDVQLKRRHDLIPGLVNAVQGAMTFERSTLERVMQARSAARSAAGPRSKATAENGLTAALGSLYAVVESYPDLKSNRNISQLQEELTATENRIAFARQLYNDLVANYRTLQQVFPNNIVASRFGFSPEEYLAADEAAQTPPPVDLKARA